MNILVFFYVLGVVMCLYKVGQYDAETKIERHVELLSVVLACLLWPTFVICSIGYITQRRKTKKRE